MWEMAKKLVEGEMSGVWKTKRGPDGKQLYPSFTRFARAELGLSERYVRTALKLYARFSDEDVPVTKQRFRLEIAPDAHPDLLEKLNVGRTGKSKSHKVRAA
jgi:hypothetical protein